MKKTINIALKTLILTIILAMLISSPILANGSADGIEVSPNVINLDSKGGSFSIHTNIPFSIVQDVSLSADGNIIPISATFADDRGDLVVKFNPRNEDGGYLISVGDVTFELTVSSYSGLTTYYDIVRVISCGK